MPDLPALCSVCGCVVLEKHRRPGLTLCACIVTGRFTRTERIADLEAENAKLRAVVDALEGAEHDEHCLHLLRLEYECDCHLSKPGVRQALKLASALDLKESSDA